MLLEVHPKLPMRDVARTRAYYVERLGFALKADYGDYLLVRKEHVELHFFSHPELDPLENDGQVYIRVRDIGQLYSWIQEQGLIIHPHGALETKPWRQREFSLLDPDHNLLTFGESH